MLKSPHNILLFALLFSSSIAFAQTEDKLPLQQPTDTSFRFVFGVYPNLLAPSAKVEFPRGNWSFGFFTTAYWPWVLGGKVEPFARVYFDKNPPKGLYLQTKATVGMYYEYYNSNFYASSYPGEYTYVSVGGGIGVGYQWILPKKANLALDIFGGVQVSVPVPYGDDPTGRLIIHYIYPAFPLEFGFRIGKAYYRKSVL